jgi:hypothetical protein
MSFSLPSLGFSPPIAEEKEGYDSDKDDSTNARSHDGRDIMTVFNGIILVL